MPRINPKPPPLPDRLIVSHGYIAGRGHRKQYAFYLDCGHKELRTLSSPPTIKVLGCYKCYIELAAKARATERRLREVLEASRGDGPPKLKEHQLDLFTTFQTEDSPTDV